MTDAEARAKARGDRMWLHKAHLGEQQADPEPVFGAEAISLVTRLTRSSYSLAGSPTPTYTRATIPCKFVRWSER
jgi:hypothetical protein